MFNVISSSYSFESCLLIDFAEALPLCFPFSVLVLYNSPCMLLCFFVISSSYHYESLSVDLFCGAPSVCSCIVIIVDLLCIIFRVNLSLVLDHKKQ